MARRFHLANDLPRALQSYLRHLKRHPAQAEILHLVGGIYYQLGNRSAALDYLQKAVHADPANADYCNDLAGFYLAAGRMNEAQTLFKRALELKPDYFQARNNLGLALVHGDKIEQAIACFREVIAQQPDFADAHYNLGVAYERNQQLELAVGEYEAAIRLSPTLAVAHFNLGKAYQRLERNESAVNCFRNVLKITPGYTEAMLGLGESLVHSWHAREAIPWLERYLAERPDSRRGLLQLGFATEVTGDLTAAESIYRRALAIYPDSEEAWYFLATAKKFSSSDAADLAAMEALHASPSLPDEARCLLSFALGKAYDDCREYDKAFQRYSQGNQLKRQALRQGAGDENHCADVADIIRVFSADFFKKRGRVGSDSDLPIFVIGMPRSGTTLTEQILSAHPQVHGAGELHYFSSLTMGMDKFLKTSTGYPDACDAIDESNFALLSEPYLKLLRWHSASALHVVDKMPTNYRELGLIATLFPRATFVHCERDPLDTCLSIYFQHFAKGNQYSYDLLTIGKTYLDYRRLMSHWKAVLPVRIHTCRYEDMVSDPEQNARGLIAACGLEWNQRCLQFHKTERDIRTASIAQARSPIYTGSRQRWRHYEQYLRPLIEMLSAELAVETAT